MDKTKDLYFIANCGCDATTYGLVELDNDEFSRFKEFVANLNKNSYYGCMPTIEIYEANYDDLKEISEYVTEIDNDDWGIYCNGEYIDKEKLFYIDNKIYTFKEDYFSYYTDWKEIEVG